MVFAGRVKEQGCKAPLFEIATFSSSFGRCRYDAFGIGSKAKMKAATLPNRSLARTLFLQRDTRAKLNGHSCRGEYRGHLVN